MSRRVPLLYVAVLALLTLLMINVVSTLASTPTPSVPEFTIETVSFPYDVPETRSVDEYTGEEIIHSGYHVENKTTQLKITNQDFTPYEIQENGVNWTINLFYNIRLKGSFSDSWHFHRLHNGSRDGNLVQDYDSEYTVVPINSYLPSEGSVDFQIQALIGYEQGIVTYPGLPGTQRVITGEASGWSEIQTLAIGKNQTSTASLKSTPSPEATPTPDLTSMPSHELQPVQIEPIVGAAIVALIIGAASGLLVWRIKRK